MEEQTKILITGALDAFNISEVLKTLSESSVNINTINTMRNEDYSEVLTKNNLNSDTILNFYNAVFYIKSESAESEEQFEDNASRWVGTEHLRIVKTEGRLVDEIRAVFGIPKPLEIERKLLIKMPNLELLESLKTCRKIPITQAYLTTPSEGRFRVRKRGDGANALYIKTQKEKISDVMRIEIESYISKEEYNAYLSQKDFITGVISKDRYCILANDSYFELDVYPFFNDTATLEIELLSETEEFKLPDFAELIRDVSAEKEYRNSYLAQKFGKMAF